MGTFVTLDSSLLDVGDPVKKEIFDQIKCNEDDLDSRLTLQEQGASKVKVFIQKVINASPATTITELDLFQATADFTLTEFKIQIFETGTLTGTLEADVKKSTTTPATGSFTSVMATKPSIDLGLASDYDESNNAAFDSGQIDVSDGDFLRLDITSLPTGGVFGEFLVKVFGELS